MKKLSPQLYFLRKTIDFFMVGMFVVLLLFFWTLYKGPISVPYLKPYIIQALNYDESDYSVGIGDVNLELVRSVQPLRITAEDINLKKKDGTFAISAPKLYLSFSLRALLKGIVAPSDVSLDSPTAYIFADYGVEKEHIDEANKKKLAFYVDKFKDFLNNYNSPEKIYPESYVNNINIKGAEVEFHEVDLGRKWMLSDLNLEFSRNLVNLELNADALVNLNDKVASVGFESEYHAASDKLDLEVYFSDLNLSDIMDSFENKNADTEQSVFRVEVPVNGKVSTEIDVSEILLHPENAAAYLSDAVRKINFELDGGHGFVTFDNDEKYNYEIDEMLLAGELTGGFDELNIKNADFKMGGQTAQISFVAKGLENYYLEHSLEGVTAEFTAKIDEFSLEYLSRFWPRYLAEPAWQWCKDGLTGGQAKNGNFVFKFGYDNKTKSFGLLNLDGVADLEDGDLHYLDGMPDVHNVYGRAKFSMQNISIDVDKGVSDGVIITGGNVNIYDLNKNDNFISINLIGNSSITDALNLINNPPLKIAAGMGVDPKTIHGNVDVQLKLDFELKQNLDSKDIKVDVKADLHDVSNSDFVPGHTMSAKNLLLSVDTAGWSLSGEAKYDTLPIKLAINEKFAEKKYKSKCNISFKLDDEAKKALGIDWAILEEPNISGYAIVDADITVQQNDEIAVKVKADLKNTAIDFAYLGFVKPLNQTAAASADVVLIKDKIKSVSNIKLQKSGFNIAGGLSMYPSGRVKSVDINQIKGPKTSARAKVSISDSENPWLKVEISGLSYDLSPFFEQIKSKRQKDNKHLPVQANDDDGFEKANNTDIFMTVNSLWTNNTTPIQNFAGSAKIRKGIGMEELHMVGNYGIDKSIKLKLDYIPKGNKEHYLSIDSNNAGSTFKVLRLYDNMVGGTMKIEARRLADKKFIGHMQVRDFSIQNAPVVAKLLSVASFTGMLDLLKGDGLTFTHFNAPFEYQYKILTLKQAKAEGNVVGITTNGTYNRATDDIKMKGVIAPAYSINRFLGKIPVVGNLLASKDGTIFAATYKITGNADDAKVDINSLSMLSPNSLKEWYAKNFGDGTNGY